MPLDLRPGTITTFGTIAGYTLSTVRRDAQPADVLSGTRAVALRLSNGTNTYDIAVSEEGPYGAGTGFDTGLAIIKAFAAIGAQTTLGAPGQTPITGATPASGGPIIYTRAVPLTPGTPVPAGRGALVKGSGAASLKLQGGGAITVSDVTGGSGTRIDGYAVVDADVPSGVTVQVLY